MIEKDIIYAIQRMIKKLPTWNEDAVICMYPDGEFDCYPLSIFQAISREHKIREVFRCHDLDDIYPNFGKSSEDVWSLAEELLIRLLY